jgi:hypothetical protein
MAPRILLASTDLMARATLVRGLRALGGRVETVGAAWQVLDALGADDPPDLVVLARLEEPPGPLQLAAMAFTAGSRAAFLVTMDLNVASVVRAARALLERGTIAA